MINKIKECLRYLYRLVVYGHGNNLELGNQLEIIEDIKCELDKLKVCINSEELRELKIKLRQEMNLRNAVLDHLDDMVWAKDLDGRYLMTNKAFREKFCYGLSDPEILGKTDLELAKMFKERVGNENHTFGEKCRNSDEVIHDTQEAMQFLESGNINGKVMKLVVNKSPLRDYKGYMYGTCGTGRDVTEWHAAMEKAIEGDKACFPETKKLVLQELNRLEFL